MVQRARAWLGRAVVSGVIIFIWALIVTFAVLFHVPLANDASPISNSSAVCSAAVYTGEVCRAHLRMSQDCLADRSTSSEVYISASSSEQEPQAQQLLTGLQLLTPTPECRAVVEPFLCLYIFGLCDSSGELYLPSSGECDTLTTETCAREWMMAQTVLGSDQLPQCGSLSERSLGCAESNLTVESVIEVSNGTNTSDGSLMCADDFYPDDSGVCLPDCADFHLYPTAAGEAAASALILIAAVVGIVSGIVVMLLSCAQYKTVFGFPSALVRYQTVTMVLYDVVVLMGVADHKVFYCSNRNLVHTLQNPTPYCTLSGMVFTYVYWQLTIWWLCHITAMFWGLRFPFQAHKFDVTGKTKYLHLTVVVLGLTLPWIPVIVAFATGGFVITRLPPGPVTCFGKSFTAFHYSLIFPAAIADATGLTLLLLIFWIIFKESRALTVSEAKRKLPEIKIFIIICYFLGVSVLAIVSYSLSFWIGSFYEELTRYILCQSTGIQPGAELCNRSELNRIVCLQAMYDTVAVFFTLIPTVNLLYAINPERIKRLYIRCSARLKHSDNDKVKSYTTYTLDTY